jgi:hypothetical protein
MEKVRNAYRILFGKTERRIQLERPWYRWEDNIKMGFKEIQLICVAQVNSDQ